MADKATSSDGLTPEALVERELAGRARAAWAGLGGALAITFGFFVTTAISAGAPGVLITDALRDATGAKLDGEDGPGLLASNIVYLHDKAALLTLGSVLQILGWIGFGVLLLFLYDAAKGRRPQVPAWVRSLLLTAIVASVLGVVLTRIGELSSFSDFISSDDHSSVAARDARTTSLIQLGGYVGLFGLFGIVVSWIIISLNSMRVGLLTRFLGTLGIISAILLMFPQFLQMPVLQIFWMVATALTALGKAPAGQPPAWKTGKAEPWPTKQEAQEARERARQGKPAKATAKAVASPATSARKRKRRN